MKPTNALGGDLFDCKVSFHFVYPVFDGEVRASLEEFELALHTPSGTALGRFEGCAIDQEFALALEVDLLI